jgi:hypothetical protein
VGDAPEERLLMGRPSNSPRSFGSRPLSWCERAGEHPVPARRLRFLLAGEVEVTAGGETRRFVPGDVALVEDTSGPGHATTALAGTGFGVVRL